MIIFDHMQVEARDINRSASLLAEILGAGAPTPEGEDGDMLRVDLAHSGFLLFSPAEAPRSVHVAFRVDAARFSEIIERLRARQISFGNEPNNTSNGAQSDPLGGAGRIYFVDEDRHLWEVTC